MICTAKEFLSFVVSLFPDFDEYWNSYDNYFLDDDGEFSVSGVCAQLSHYFYEEDKIREIPEASIAKLFDFIEVELNTNNSILDDAICTCFLENIACTEAGEYVQKFMGEKAKSYFLDWHIM